MSFRDVSKIEELLELYEEEDLLWNTSHEHYYRKDMRRQALNRISAMLGVTGREVTRKITNLRTYYGREISKVKSSRLKAAKGGDLFVSKWEHFNTMDRFLSPFITARKPLCLPEGEPEDDGAEQEEPEDDTGDYQILKQEDACPEEDTEDTPSESRKRKHEEEKLRDHQTGSDVKARPRRIYKRNHEYDQTDVSNQDVVQPMSSHARNSVTKEDGEDVFGRHVGNELRLISDFRTRQLIKLKIQKLLFDAQCGDLSADSSCNVQTGLGSSSPTGI